MFLTDVTNRGAIPALEKLVAFTQARHRMLAENIANIDTPGYKAKQLDAGGFQAALGEALADRRAAGSRDFRLESTEQFELTERGRLKVTPTTEPVENLLFHDGTNARVERQMAHLAENAMMHELAVELLNGKFSGLLTAIRGRVQ